MNRRQAMCSSCTGNQRQQKSGDTDPTPSQRKPTKTGATDETRKVLLVERTDARWRALCRTETGGNWKTSRPLSWSRSDLDRVGDRKEIDQKSTAAWQNGNSCVGIEEDRGLALAEKPTQQRDLQIERTDQKSQQTEEQKLPHENWS
jgi:hypothetical protein